MNSFWFATRQQVSCRKYGAVGTWTGVEDGPDRICHRVAKTPLELRTISTHNAQNEFVKENARGYIHDECRANFVMTAQTRSARSGGIGFTLTSLLFL